MPESILTSVASGNVQKSPFSKAAAIWTRGAYIEYVSTAKWRERRWRLFSTFPRRNFNSRRLYTHPWVAGAVVGLLLGVRVPLSSFGTEADLNVMRQEEVLRLGEKFGLVVGEVDEEIRDFLGLTRAEGVVVFEVIGGKPADLAGIKPRALIKEINSVDIKTLEDFGKALKSALKEENFSVATYEPPDLDTQGVSGGINFHFVRIEKS